jgi:hypothetical protein
MRRKMFNWRDVTIWQEESKFFITYDVGTVATIMRKDEISPNEAEILSKGDEAAIVNFLWGLQRKLTSQGINAYGSNYSPSPDEIDNSR